MKFTRDAERVKATLVVKDGAVVTASGCRIIFPDRFVERNLAILAETNYVYGIFALVLEDNTYSVCSVNAMMRVLPTRIEKIKIDGEPYQQLSFEPKSVVIASTKLVKKEALIYNVFDEFVFKGKVPWYLDYEDLGKLFDTSDKHAGSNVNKNLALIELMVSILARNPKDPNQLYRMIADETPLKPEIVSLNNVYYSAAGTVNKLAGAYFTEGLTSALVQPTEETSKIERILRA